MSEESALALARDLMQRQNKYVLATVDEGGRPRMRWMGAWASDPEQAWVFYMLCGARSRKMTELAGNPAVQLMFTSEDYTCIVTLEGAAGSVDDLAVKRMVYEAIPASPKFYKSPEDPNMGVIRFQTTTIEVLCLQEGHEPVRIELER